MDSHDEIVYVNLAMLYNSTSRYSDAIDILKADPNQSKSEFVTNSENYQFAIGFLNLKKYDTAKIFIDKYLVTGDAKKDELAFYRAAIIYFQLEDKPSACKFIQQANQLIIENKTDELIKTASENIKKRWFYKKYTEDIKMIKNSSNLFCE